MGRTACTEPQCLYSRTIPLLPLWAVRPVQSLSACTVQLYLFAPYGPYGLYRASVPVQGCTLPFILDHQVVSPSLPLPRSWFQMWSSVTGQNRLISVGASPCKTMTIGNVVNPIAVHCISVVHWPPQRYGLFSYPINPTTPTHTRSIIHSALCECCRTYHGHARVLPDDKGVLFIWKSRKSPGSLSLTNRGGVPRRSEFKK